jgi:hypothetical protein
MLKATGGTGHLQYYNPNERKTLLKGVDYWQGDWPLTSGTDEGYKIPTIDGCDFMILRAGKADTVTDDTTIADTQFTAANVAKFRAAGLKVGTYWYARPINVYRNLGSNYAGGYTDANLQAEATKEANNYADLLESVFGEGKCGDIIPCCDFEDNQFESIPEAVMTANQAFVWLKQFCDTMYERFPQLDTATGGKGVMLYTAYYFVDGLMGDDNDIRSTEGQGIAEIMPALWFSANDPALGIHGSAGSGSYNASTGHYDFRKFGGYEYWVMWQYSTDRNRHAPAYGQNHVATDMNVLDSNRYSLNDVLVYPETLPNVFQQLKNKPTRIHSHIGEYLPINGGCLEGPVKIHHQDAFYFRQEQNKSWKLHRKSNSVANTHVAGDIALTPSSTYYLPSSNPETVTWDTTKTITFTEDGEITTKSFDSSKVVPAQYTVTNIPTATYVDETAVTLRNATDTGGGSWFSSANASHYGGTIQLTKVTGEFATYTFIGTGIEWYTATSTNRGIAEIYIDGVLQTTYDGYAGSAGFQVKAYEKTDLAFGSHTIKIVVTNTKNASSTDYYVVIDALRVLNSGTAITNYVKKYNGTAAPETTPTALGEMFVDTTNGKVYVSTGTSSSADWKILN